jgi:hypothetical protein
MIRNFVVGYRLESVLPFSYVYNQIPLRSILILSNLSRLGLPSDFPTLNFVCIYHLSHAQYTIWENIK